MFKLHICYNKYKDKSVLQKYLTLNHYFFLELEIFYESARKSSIIFQYTF